MAVIIEANYSKKVGLPHYSSHQYSVTLRTELADLSQLERTNAELYSRLQTSVDGQIVNTGLVPSDQSGRFAAPGSGSGQPETFRSRSSTGPDSTVTSGNDPGEAGWRCSDKQRDLILKIVADHSLQKQDIEDLSVQRFGVGVRQLNKMQASGLIDELLETCTDRRQGRGNGGGRGSYRRTSGYPAAGRAGR
ncbi:hypothetical protein OPIT5_29935 [Opitutaceae bacterium TAV5]|nr:hypothetical protein OPIT5_29935 [Opitutaceae bacterium TAV5]